MSGKDHWKLTMGARAKEFTEYMERNGVCISECMVCAPLGRGMRADFGGHVAGPFHFKDFARLLPDGRPIDQLREELWQQWCFKGGAARFNHADGVVEVYIRVI